MKTNITDLFDLTEGVASIIYDSNSDGLIITGYSSDMALCLDQLTTILLTMYDGQLPDEFCANFFGTVRFEWLIEWTESTTVSNDCSTLSMQVE